MLSLGKKEEAGWRRGEGWGWCLLETKGSIASERTDEVENKATLIELHYHWAYKYQQHRVGALLFEIQKKRKISA